MKPQFFLLFAGISILTFDACSTPKPAAPIATKVDYEKQIKPIFVAYCYQCHGDGKSRAGFHIDSKANVMKEIVMGDPAHSYLYQAMARSIGASDHMPPADQDQPDDADIATIKQWITEGASWPDGV